jgi:hypothetical protein
MTDIKGEFTMSEIALTNDLGTRILEGETLCTPTFEASDNSGSHLVEAVSVDLCTRSSDFVKLSTRGVLTIHRVSVDRFSVHLTCLDILENFYFGSRWTVECLEDIVKVADLETLEAWEPTC